MHVSRESQARNPREIIEELRHGTFANIAERSGRAQDKDDRGLETLRRGGYMSEPRDRRNEGAGLLEAVVEQHHSEAEQGFLRREVAVPEPIDRNVHVPRKDAP